MGNIHIVQVQFQAVFFASAYYVQLGGKSSQLGKGEWLSLADKSGTQTLIGRQTQPKQVTIIITEWDM